MKQTLTVTEEYNGKRLDVTVVELLEKAVSRAYIQKLCTDGEVLLNDAVIVSKTKVAEGDTVTVNLPDKKDYSKQTLPVIFEDENVTVINKPSGILTHAKGAPLDEFTVAEFMRLRTTDKPDGNRPGIVHRLDRDTSGVIICSRTSEAQSFLQRQFSDRKVKKKYIALVQGVPKASEAIIRLPLERNPNKPQTFRVGANGKPAETRYKVIQEFSNGTSLVELFPVTGRTHQLRVHMQYLKVPIIGDRLYGADAMPDTRLCLHASELEITIPGGKRSIFTAPLPDDFAAVCGEQNRNM